jgi:hypothetical protein
VLYLVSTSDQRARVEGNSVIMTGSDSNLDSDGGKGDY